MPTSGNNAGFDPAHEVRTGRLLDHIAFPLGGIGAGCICVSGTGGFTHVAVRHQPAMHHEPLLFAAIGVAGRPELARVLEGPVPPHKVFGRPGTGLGLPGTSYGLPRFREATFAGRFPFAEVALTDADFPYAVRLVAWSPFEPGDADHASLPVAGLEYTIENTGTSPLELTCSFHASNFLRTRSSPGSVAATPRGFALSHPGTPEAPAEAASLVVETDHAAPRVDVAWFRGGWFDPLSLVWKSIASGAAISHPIPPEGDPSPGGSLYAPFRLAPGERHTITFRLSWHAPRSNLRRGGPNDEPAPAPDDPDATHRPWYANWFADAGEVARWWTDSYDALRTASRRFSDCLFSTDLPAGILDAVSANLSILKSPTVLRQLDGRFWAWEGCDDTAGSCYGTCTHVWNYAQALAHLFPRLERSIRESEHAEALDARGHQDFRTPIPIRPSLHTMHAAADGQLGAIMKAYRDWRMSGDTGWVRDLWPALRRSLDYAIATWDPDHEGWLVEPQHNTYDIEFWGPNGMLTSVYLGALVAATRIGRAIGEEVDAYATLAARARDRLEQDLFHRGRFIQRVRWQGLRAGDPAELWSLGGKYSTEARALLAAEGPKYQYGDGVLADGIIGAWFAEVCGLGGILDDERVASHLRAVHAHNFRRSLHDHANPQRPGYALGDEAGLLLCTWPDSDPPTLPFVYSNEVWTGIEYQVASHLILCGELERGLEIVRAVRARHDGTRRNPYDEYECGHWYARALASYALLQACSGARFDAVAGELHLAPRVAGDFRAFFAWATGYGTVGVRDGEPFIEIAAGTLAPHRLIYQPCEATTTA